jgi:hypothetical protein
MGKDAESITTYSFSLINRKVRIRLLRQLIQFFQIILNARGILFVTGFLFSLKNVSFANLINGLLAEWLGNGLQNRVRRSESARDLFNFLSNIFIVNSINGELLYKLPCFILTRFCILNYK